MRAAGRCAGRAAAGRRVCAPAPQAAAEAGTVGARRAASRRLVPQRRSCVVLTRLAIVCFRSLFCRFRSQRQRRRRRRAAGPAAAASSSGRRRRSSSGRSGGRRCWRRAAAARRPHAPARSGRARVVVVVVAWRSLQSHFKVNHEADLTQRCCRTVGGQCRCLDLSIGRHGVQRSGIPGVGNVAVRASPLSDSRP